jgi:hypothetical protein
MIYLIDNARRALARCGPIALLILVLALMGRRMGQIAKEERHDRALIAQIEANYQASDDLRRLRR